MNPNEIIEQQHDTVITHLLPDGRRASLLAKREIAIANVMTGERRFISEEPVFHTVEGVCIPPTQFTHCLCCGAAPIWPAHYCSTCKRATCTNCCKGTECVKCAPAWKRFLRWLKHP